MRKTKAQNDLFFISKYLIRPRDDGFDVQASCIFFYLPFFSTYLTELWIPLFATTVSVCRILLETVITLRSTSLLLSNTAIEATKLRNLKLFFLIKVTNEDDENAGTKDRVACCGGSLLEKLLFLLALILSWINKEAIFTNGTNQGKR